MDVWKWQKSTLCQQVQMMSSNMHRLALSPSPLLIFFLENDLSHVLYYNVLMLPCPFCFKGFEPSWIVNSLLASMLTILGVHLIIFQLLQNVCTVRRKCT
jgi:hypothetical protein